MAAMNAINVPVHLVGDGVVVMPLKDYETNRAGTNYWAEESHKTELRVNKLKDVLLSCRNHFIALAVRNSEDRNWCEQAILEIHAALGIEGGAFDEEEQ